MTPILSFGLLTNLSNQGPLVGQAVAFNTISSLEYIVPPNPSKPVSYKLAQSVGPFLVYSHFMFFLRLTFFNENLSVVQAKLIPTIYIRG